MRFLSLVPVILAGSSFGDAFVAPRAFTVARPFEQSLLHMLPPSSTLLLSDEMIEATTDLVNDVASTASAAAAAATAAIVASTPVAPAVVPDSGVMTAVFDTLKTVFYGVTAIIFILAGITYITASFIIPKAAEQVEEQTKNLAPELWEEYEAKLLEGETLAMRPDLMQELGEKIKPLLAAEAAREFSPPPQDDGSVLSSEFTAPATDAVDVKIIDEKDEEDAASTKDKKVDV